MLTPVGHQSHRVIVVLIVWLHILVTALELQHWRPFFSLFFKFFFTFFIKIFFNLAHRQIFRALARPSKRFSFFQFIFSLFSIKPSASLSHLQYLFFDSSRILILSQRTSKHILPLTFPSFSSCHPAWRTALTSHLIVPAEHCFQCFADSSRSWPGISTL